MSHPKIYQSEAVVTVQQLHRPIIEERLSYSSVLAELEAYVINLQNHYNLGNPAVSIEISNYHPHMIALPPKAIFDAELQMADFQHVIAGVYGFASWKEVKTYATKKHDPNFETAIDLLLAGQVGPLTDWLKQYPYLINSRSAYAHKAGLIHYLSANGLEIWRQVIPDNINECLLLLLQFGADPEMTANLYGINNLLALLTSSDHAWKAGVAKGAIKLLRSRGISK